MPKYTALNNPILIPLCKTLDLPIAHKQLFTSAQSSIRIEQKFDGIRCLFVRQPYGSFKAITRNQNPITSIPHLCNYLEEANNSHPISELIDTLDCELVSDSIPFAELNGLIRRQSPSILSETITAKVIAVNNNSNLSKMFDSHSYLTPLFSSIPSITIPYSAINQSELSNIISAIRLDKEPLGWEGIILKVNTPSSSHQTYAFGLPDSTIEVRLPTWFKYKFRHEGTFRLLSYTIGTKGKVKGMVNTIRVRDSSGSIAVIGSGLSKSLSDLILSTEDYSNLIAETEYETAIGSTLRGAVIKSIREPLPSDSLSLFKHSRK